MRDAHVWLVMLGACASAPNDNPARLVDSSGAEFAWSCTTAAGCALDPLATTPPLPSCGGAVARYEGAWGRFFEIDAACTDATGWSSSPNLGRPVACGVDADCPQIDVYSTPPARFECRSTLCQSTDTALYPVDRLSWSDAYLMCYATLDRTATLQLTDAIAQQIDALVSASCATGAASCTLPLPSACAQP
jgi:hypothetical protein